MKNETQQDKRVPYSVSLTFHSIKPQNPVFDREFKSKLVELTKLAKDNGVQIEAREFGEITPELTKAVEEYFSTHTYQGYGGPFKLDTLKRSDLNSQIIHAVPINIDEELEGDQNWEAGLAKFGQEFGVPLKLPYWCYSK